MEVILVLAARNLVTNLRFLLPLHLLGIDKRPNYTLIYKKARDSLI